jgi:hypothetical protein
MTAQDRHAIGILIDRFVKDAVRRENLRAAWPLTGPDLRGGTTRAAWVRGTGVTVEEYPALGNDFRNAWTGTLVGPGHAELALVMHPQPGHRDVPETAMSVDLRKIDGRWVVNSLYPAATFESGGRVIGPNDFMAGPPGSPVGNGSSRIAARWVWIAGGVIGTFVALLPIGIWVAIKRRDSRAYAAYAAGAGQGRTADLRPPRS